MLLELSTINRYTLALGVELVACILPNLYNHGKKLEMVVHAIYSLPKSAARAVQELMWVGLVNANYKIGHEIPASLVRLVQSIEVEPASYIARLASYS